MNDTGGAIVGAVLLIGIVVAYVRERRARARPATTEAAPAPPPPVDADATTEVVRSASPNWGAPIIFCLLLIAADTHRNSAWGYLWQALYGAVVLFAVYSTFNPKELADEMERRPGTTRAHHYVMLGVPYVVVPVVAWTLLFPFGWRPAVLLPVLPWVLLLLVSVPMMLRKQ